ncbi:MAG: hypothetical protein P8099_13300 [Gemmatimonadota bacterium]
MMQMSMAPSDVETATARLEPGKGTIKGSAVLRQRGGRVVTCAGNEVFLIPATESASKELRRIFGSDEGYVNRGGNVVTGGGRLVRPPQPNRSTACDPQGYFTFSNVRAGKWYVMTNVVWSANGDYQGGTLLGTAEVAEGEASEIVLSL